MPIGLKGNTDGSGAIQVGGSDAITLSTALNTTLAGSLNAPNTFGFKNRIINGDMRIDQRNAGASVSLTSNPTYTLDRWVATYTQNSKFTVQQNAASVTPPVGFTNYLGCTSTSAYSLVSSDIFVIRQPIEGLNVADLAWGTANAATVTLSFWVRSSLTGTFGGAIYNSAGTRSYPFTYTINSANTWEKETITIAGDTTGTWLTTNGIGIQVAFNLGSGATNSGTAGAWAGTLYTSATGAVSVVGTNGATFYVTGVQLERGSIATSFDYLDYGRSLIQCQRYYWKVTTPTVAVASGVCVNTTISNQYVKFPVSMRIAPQIAQFSTYVNIGTGSYAVTSLSSGFIGVDSALVQPTTAGSLVAIAGALWLINAGYIDATSEL
jgi:hypothetical protein